MNNTAEFEFNLGDTVVDSINGDYVEIVGRYRSGSINSYELATPRGYIIYRTESHLTNTNYGEE